MRTIDKVEILLRNDQKYRDSDKKLLLEFWRRQGFELSETQRRIFMDKCTTAESITRARRKLKEKYPASIEVDNERHKKYVEYKYNNGVMYQV